MKTETQNRDFIYFCYFSIGYRIDFEPSIDTIETKLKHKGVAAVRMAGRKS